MVDAHRKRRLIVIFSSLIIFVFVIFTNTPSQSISSPEVKGAMVDKSINNATSILDKITIKDKASKSNYSRSQFGGGWVSNSGCDTRNIILNRDLTKAVVNEKCEVTSGILDDPYSGKEIAFTRGSGTSDDIQIDHVVALSDAWQTGAQQLSLKERTQLANDPLELLAVDGPTNQQKSDADAASWLPPNKPFRCQYIARQIAVKQKYSLWITQPEYDSMVNILSKCIDQLLPSP